jgi:hypothetical protein
MISPSQPIHFIVYVVLAKCQKIQWGKKRAPLHTRNKNKGEITRKGWELVL